MITKSVLDRSGVDVLPVPAVITADRWQQGGATILFANPVFCELTGYPAAELEGRNLHLLHGVRTEVRLRRQPVDGVEVGEGEAWLYRRNGSSFRAAWNFRAMAGGDGAMLVVFRDESAAWHQREALMQAQKLGTVGLLAGGVAHDFNNLLSVINGYCEILTEKLTRLPAAKAAKKDLEEIHRAGLKAAAIARQLLEFSRRSEAEPVVINYNTLIREIAEIIRRSCGELIEVEFRLASDLGNVRFSPIHFQQVLLNLCFNARDAMPEGGRLRVRSYRLGVNDADGALPAGAYAALEVKDTGTGIPPAVLARIFEPFYTTKSEGTGLGLSTALAMVRQAGGDLLARSKTGHGTTFELLLPETAEAENRGVTALGSLPTSRGTETVWVVERDDALRKMISGILTIDGYAVSEAPTLEEALGGKSAPQLLIADTPPERAATGGVRLLEKRVSLRLISTAVEAPKISGLLDGHLAHLPKPFALSSLLSKVREMLDAKSSRLR